jgi:hypothetical protein
MAQMNLILQIRGLGGSGLKDLRFRVSTSEFVFRDEGDAARLSVPKRVR